MIPGGAAVPARPPGPRGGARRRRHDLGQLLARDAAAAPAAQDEPVVGGTLREGYDLDFSKLDPVATNWYDPAFLALYESLLIDTPDGTLQPKLAEAWEVSEDGMRSPSPSRRAGSSTPVGRSTRRP